MLYAESPSGKEIIWCSTVADVLAFERNEDGTLSVLSRYHKPALPNFSFHGAYAFVYNNTFYVAEQTAIVSYGLDDSEKIVRLGKYEDDRLNGSLKLVGVSMTFDGW